MMRKWLKLILKGAPIGKSTTCMVYHMWVMCGMNGWCGEGSQWGLGGVGSVCSVNITPHTPQYNWEQTSPPGLISTQPLLGRSQPRIFCSDHGKIPWNGSHKYWACNIEEKGDTLIHLTTTPRLIIIRLSKIWIIIMISNGGLASISISMRETIRKPSNWSNIPRLNIWQQVKELTE